MDRRPALAGHAAFEAYSVLTRLPAQLRLTAGQAADVLAKTFPEVCWLSATDLDQLRVRLALIGIVGGSVYDALVGMAAEVNGLVLLTRDIRAERTYRALGVTFESVT